MRALRVALVGLWVASCQAPNPLPPTPNPEATALLPVPTSQPKPGAALAIKPFAEELKDISVSYTTIWRITSLTARFGPVDCADPHLFRKIKVEPATTPTGYEYPKPQLSDTSDASTHGQKLYYLFVRDQVAFEKSLQGAPSPVGQAVLKETWRVEKLPAGSTQPATEEYLPNPYLKRGEDLYRAAEKSSLFIMYKLPSDTPDTDEGWVYGTVSPTGEVTSAGRVESCMGCHQKAPNRLLSKPSR